MSKFLATLDTRLLVDSSNDGRGSWQLTAPLMYESDLLGRTVTVPAGFVTDFASVPRIPVAWLLAGDCGHEAAVVHDWLYTSHEVDRATADAVLQEALAASGQPAWRSWLMWAGVRVGGARPYEADGQKQYPHVEAVIEQSHPEAS